MTPDAPAAPFHGKTEKEERVGSNTPARERHDSVTPNGSQTMVSATTLEGSAGTNLLRLLLNVLRKGSRIVLPAAPIEVRQEETDIPLVGKHIQERQSICRRLVELSRMQAETEGREIHRSCDRGNDSCSLAHQTMPPREQGRQRRPWCTPHGSGV